MKTLIVSLGLCMIPCFAAGGSTGGSSASTVKLAATFVGIVLAALLRTWLVSRRSKE